MDREINPELLHNAFFYMKNDRKKYEKYSPQLKEFVESIIKNMSVKYQYSSVLALDTIVFALRKDIISFEKILS